MTTAGGRLGETLQDGSTSARRNGFTGPRPGRVLALDFASAVLDGTGSCLSPTQAVDHGACANRVVRVVNIRYSGVGGIDSQTLELGTLSDLPAGAGACGTPRSTVRIR